MTKMIQHTLIIGGFRVRTGLCLQRRAALAGIFFTKQTYKSSAVTPRLMKSTRKRTVAAAIGP